MNQMAANISDFLEVVSTDERWEGFQGVHFNADGSLLVIHRWGGRYFPSVSAYLESLAEYLKQLGKAQVTDRVEPVPTTINSQPSTIS